MYYFQFHVGDYTSSTAHLSELEDLAYRRMLDWCYLQEKPLPEAVEDIARLIRMRSHSDCIASVLREFFERTQDGWVNRRALREIEAFKGKSEKARQSAKARWDANALRPQSEGNANQEPITKNHKPITNNQEPVTKNQEPENHEPKVKRQAIACPPDVDHQVWIDWVQLRKTKRAPVTQTVLDGARKEADKAGMSLTDFLAVWCRRGSQGLEASWLKASEIKPKAGKQLDPAWAEYYSRSSANIIDATTKVIE